MYLGNYKGNWYRIFPRALWGWKRMIVILVSVNFILCIGANARNKVYMKYRILSCALEKSVYDIKNLKITDNYNENCIFYLHVGYWVYH